MEKTSFPQHILIPIRQSIENFADRHAFFIAEKYYSYAEFGHAVSKIRSAIRQLNTGEQVFGLAIHDDLETYAAVFALWMEGKAYVPLHPNQPLERNLNIISQVGLHNVVDSAAISPHSQFNVIKTKELAYESDFLDGWAEMDESALAYILFTSGSTGTPKGVTISRRNVSAFMDSFWQTGIVITEEDRCLQCFDLTFDVSVQSYLVALTRGACLYTVPYGQVKYLVAASLMTEHKITFGAMAPSMLTYLRPYFDELEADSMKSCILTAEACPLSLMEDWFACAKNVELYDFYGPTEATIYCTAYKLTREGKNLSLNGIISIGKPLANVKAIIIDEDYNVMPQGEKGELCVAGDQVTQGYWNNPEKNRSSFFEKEVDGKKMRFYHTGDLCYFEQDGNIMYSGRIDQQAKIQGFRVELGEIEYHAREYFNREKRVMAIAFQNDKDLTEIALFIESEPVDIKPLEEYMRGKMPHYMIPTRVLFEQAFPLNKSEKVDRKQLKNMLK